MNNLNQPGLYDAVLSPTSSGLIPDDAVLSGHGMPRPDAPKGINYWTQVARLPVSEIVVILLQVGVPMVLLVGYPMTYLLMEPVAPITQRK